MPHVPLHLIRGVAARLALLAGLGLSSFGCVLTDYGDIDPPIDKSVAIRRCVGTGTFDVSLRTIVPATQEMVYTETDPGTGQAICLADRPLLTPDRVSRQDAMTWHRCLGAWAQVTEVLAGDGLWALAGVRDLPDGTERLTTYHAPGATDYTCVGAGLDPNGTEGTVVGDGYAEPPSPAPRLPGLRPAAVAIDRDPASCQFCVNIAAMDPRHAETTFSFYCLNERVEENPVFFRPICRRSAPARGDVLVFDVGWLAGECRVGITPVGELRAELVALSAGDAKYEPVQDVVVEIVPGPGGVRLVFDPPRDEAVALARFALEAGLTDRALDLPTSVPGLGLPLPGGRLWIPSAALEHAVKDPSLIDAALGRAMLR